VEDSINSFLRDLKPEIKKFFCGYQPCWSPSGTVDNDTQLWFENLKIPLVNEQPSLLLYRLLDNPNPHGDVLFQGKKNM
jgi:hypothetical protein